MQGGGYPYAAFAVDRSITTCFTVEGVNDELTAEELTSCVQVVADRCEALGDPIASSASVAEARSAPLSGSLFDAE